jgi:hypothetical protein
MGCTVSVSRVHVINSCIFAQVTKNPQVFGERNLSNNGRLTTAVNVHCRSFGFHVHFRWRKVNLLFVNFKGIDLIQPSSTIQPRGLRVHLYLFLARFLLGRCQSPSGDNRNRQEFGECVPKEVQKWLTATFTTQYQVSRNPSRSQIRFKHVICAVKCSLYVEK